MNAFANNSAVTDISASSENLIVNHNYSLFVNITNDSNEPVTTTLRLYDFNEIFFSFAYTISAQADLNIGIPWTPSRDGNRSILASIDLNDDNPIDNNKTVQIIVHKGQDIAVTNISFPPMVLPERETQATVIFQNVGDLWSGFFTLSAFLDDNRFYSLAVNPMSPSQYQSINITVPVRSIGTHILKIMADENNFLDEYTKSNNQAQISYNVSNSADGNLSRDDIYRIIDEYFKTRVDETKQALELCNAARIQINADMLACTTVKESVQSSLNSCNTDMSNARNELTNCQGQVVSQANDLRTDFEKRLSDQKAVDENAMLEQKTYFERVVLSKDQNVQAFQAETKRKSDMNVIFAVLLVLGAGLLTFQMIQKGRIPIEIKRGS
jgi:hypothetical protein